jgi:hypothetical protein
MTEEIKNIKRLLFSEDGRDLGVELTQSLGLVEKVAESLCEEVRSLLKSFLFVQVKSWRLVIDSKTVSYVGSECSEKYNYKIEYKLADDSNTYSIVGSQGTCRFVKKRADLVRLLKSTSTS